MHPRQFQLMSRQTYSPDPEGGSGESLTGQEGTETTGSPGSAETQGSPSAEEAAAAAAAAEAAAAAAAVDPAVAEAEAARAIVPEAADGFKVNLPAEFAKFAGDATDPAMVALREHAVAEKWSQGRFDDTMSLIKVFAGKGLLDQVYDPAAEAKKLGDKAEPRRQEIETFATSLKERGEIDDAEFGELAAMSLTAAGVTVLEKLRKMMGPGGGEPKTPGGGEPAGGSAMDQANAMRLDPKYDSDGTFRRKADKAWVDAWNAENPKP